jgi:hypothetical protein
MVIIDLTHAAFLAGRDLLDVNRPILRRSRQAIDGRERSR